MAGVPSIQQFASDGTVFVGPLSPVRNLFLRVDHANGGSVLSPP